MGKRGPARMPQSLRLLTGDPNLDRYNDAEPVPLSGDLECPDDASDDVRKVWERNAIELRAMDLAFPSDADAFRAFCEAVVIHEKACAVLAKSPILIQGIMGGLVRNPALAVQRDSATAIARFSNLFGMNPSARSTVQSTRKQVDDNPFAGTG